jgi:polyribonucleotide nucleotidyltransferase
LAERLPERVLELPRAVDEFVRARYRALMLDEGLRPDGRRAPDIRPLSCHVGLLPRAHGSGLFTRGQTQVLSALALGGMGEGQIIEDLPEEDTKRFMHHYNFPPYSVGEVRMLRGPSRRDIGHGMLAERALLPLLPDQETFPYTMRIVSEVLESNGSSSMASVCAATLALMDGGVPIRKPVAGIAMGMVSDETRHVILTDIQGIEDGYGDMDFKVAGTRDGITALQLDVKVGGLSHEVLTDALTQAREARLRILEVMAQTLAQPRPELAPHAPRMFVVEIHPDKIGDVIGPGGKVIKKIQADYEVRIDVEQDGRIYIAAPDQEAGEAAKKVIEDLTTDLKVGETYVGKVSRILPFGALVDLLPGKDGLIHISNLSRERVERVEDVVNVGDEVVVKVLEVDPSGKVRLTLNLAAEPGSGEGPHRGGPRRRR